MDARHTPELFLAHYTRQHGIPVADLGVTPMVVVSWMRWVVQAFTEATGGEHPPHWLYGERNPLVVGAVGGRRVGCVQLPVGAPGTVMMMEEMIACGAHAFIGLGFAGSLQPTPRTANWSRRLRPIGRRASWGWIWRRRRCMRWERCAA